jgi:N-acetylmuramoyl-L-alanine amidase
MRIRCCWIAHHDLEPPVAFTMRWQRDRNARAHGRFQRTVAFFFGPPSIFDQSLSGLSFASEGDRVAILFRLSAGMITAKLRTFGFLAIVLLGFLLSSCALFHRRAAVSAPAPAGAAELKITQSIIPPEKCGRPLHRPMRPTFITIHSTDNRSRSADALHHALAMNKGLRARHNRTGFVAWHFTVDDHSIYQTLPTNETGEHADYEGEGNRSSIGIEMCVNRGNNLDSTIDRTAQLTAKLMRQYHIPLDHVVPHMHWRMIRYSDGRDLGFKKCPRILLDGGRLGPKWSAFMEKISFYAR